MINIKLKDIIEGTEVLNKFAKQPLRGRVAFKVSKILKKLEDELIIFYDTRTEIIKKYSVKDKNGNLIIDENNNVQLNKENVEEFNREITELLNMEIEIDCNKITLDDIENVDFTPVEMTILMPLIEE